MSATRDSLPPEPQEVTQVSIKPSAFEWSNPAETTAELAALYSTSPSPLPMALGEGSEVLGHSGGRNELLLPACPTGLPPHSGNEGSELRMIQEGGKKVKRSTHSWADIPAQPLSATTKSWFTVQKPIFQGQTLWLAQGAHLKDIWVQAADLTAGMGSQLPTPSTYRFVCACTCLA